MPGNVPAAHDRPSTSTWWSYEKTSAVRLDLEPIGRLAALAGDRVGAEDAHLLDQLGAAQGCSAEKTSPDMTGRPNGQPVPSGPPMVGWK